MELQEITKGKLVTDKEKPTYGVGKIETTRDGLVYVFYDEIETTIHYQEDELKFLEVL